MTAFTKQQKARVEDYHHSIRTEADFTQIALVVGMTLIAFVGLPLAYLIGKAVTGNLFDAVSLARAISEGDLTQRLSADTDDEVGQLCSSLNQMADHLKEQTSQILEGVNILASTATEISATVTQLSASASRTSTAVTETTTTVEQVKQAAKISSEKAKNVAEISTRAAQISESGKEATEETVQRMDIIKNEVESISGTVVKLSEQSQAVEGIIAAVQDLADQSNLLAVNASIEAERAGEHGKGFSIVAQEIKNLADQSKESTEQVRTLLSDIQRRVAAVASATEEADAAVDAGVEQSVLAGESIQGLLQSVSESSQAASLIVTSSEQQFVGVDQVSSAMANVDQAMKQNLESTSHIQSAAKRLEELGRSLKAMVEHYRV
jgi:methyl-accepting chemotaxis protein